MIVPYGLLAEVIIIRGWNTVNTQSPDTTGHCNCCKI